MTTVILEHAETLKRVEVDIVATAGYWAYTSDGYYYDLRFWKGYSEK